VLEDFAAPPSGIYALFAQRRHLPLRVRLWIDFLKHHFADPRHWAPGDPEIASPAAPGS
jgi:DNA-binding transcriptional LysR family regulator